MKAYMLLGLCKGLNEVCKALDRKQAQLCVLAENCDDPKYKKLITALAKSNGIPVITIENRNDIGEWLGHCKYDKEGKARKVKLVKCQTRYGKKLLYQDSEISESW